MRRGNAPIRLDCSLALGFYEIFSLSDPMALAGGNDRVGGRLRDLNAIFDARAFHTRCSVHGIPKELKARLFSSQHTGRDSTTVQPKAHSQVARTGTQCRFEFSNQQKHLLATTVGKAGHDHGMVGTGLGQSARSHV